MYIKATDTSVTLLEGKKRGRENFEQYNTRIKSCINITIKQTSNLKF